MAPKRGKWKAAAAARRAGMSRRGAPAQEAIPNDPFAFLAPGEAGNDVRGGGADGAENAAPAAAPAEDVEDSPPPPPSPRALAGLVVSPSVLCKRIGMLLPYVPHVAIPLPSSEDDFCYAETYNGLRWEDDGTIVKSAIPRRTISARPVPKDCT